MSLKLRSDSPIGSQENLPSPLEMLIGRDRFNDKLSERHSKQLKVDTKKVRSVSDNKSLVQLINHSEKQ